MQRHAALFNTVRMIMLASLLPCVATWGCSDANSDHHCIFAKAKKRTTCPDAAEGWTSLFNGKDLTGWEPSGGSVWKVENSLLIGAQGPKFAAGDLFTTQDYRDFELKVTYKMVWPGNSGVWFRYQTASIGYQADILEWPDPIAYAGTLYCSGKMFLTANKDPELVNRTGWNTLRIKAKGDHLQLWINDFQTVDTHDNSTDHGKIGFQVHPGEQFGPMRIIVRQVMIKPL